MGDKNTNDKLFVIFSSVTSVVIVLGVFYFSENHEQTTFQKYSNISSVKQIVDSNRNKNTNKTIKKLTKKTTKKTKRTPAQRNAFDPVKARLLRNKKIAKERTVDPDGLKYESLQPDGQQDFENTTGAGYKKLKGFYAIKKTHESIRQYPGAEVKLGYLIVQSEVDLPDSKAVVENTDSGALGIFTGVIKVKLRSLSDMRQILPHQNYNIVKTYEHISVVLYGFDNYELTIESLQFFRSHTGVKRANIEVLEYARKEK